MNSIRRTLILNVTLLLVVALFTVAAIVYKITQAALQQKQNTAQNMVEMQFAAMRDEAMLTQARAIVSDTQSLAAMLAQSRANNDAPSPIDRDNFHQYQEAGIYFMAFGMNSHVTAPIWLAEHLPGRGLFNRLNWLQAADANLNHSDAAHGFVQVDADWGTIWRSRDLSGLPGAAMPFDVAQFSPYEPFQPPQFDEIEITPGLEPKARRVRLKAPLFRSGPRLPRRQGSPPVIRIPQPTLYVQVAWDDTTNDPTLNKLKQNRDVALHSLEVDNQREMAHLKSQLTWIGIGTLTIVVVGGWLLVGAGLSPLKRLTHAVSQVSAKDFKLPIEPRLLPGEVSLVAERLQQTLQQLGDAFTREKRASADISHELRTPLAALTTTLEVALRKPRSPDDYRQTIDDARQIARQMSKLVERMLMLAWLDAGADEVRPQAFDLDELVAGCAAIGKPLAEAQGLRFQVEAERSLTVRTDPDKVREVVMNLLHNAIEYNQPGGGVEIKARANAVAGGVVLEINDTGIGIPQELQGKIFERFYRGDPSRNAAGVHAGLGLAIVKEYVDRLGGHLSLESRVGTGSRFRIELPNV
jgi:signal transduction histidine kinase